MRVFTGPKADEVMAFVRGAVLLPAERLEALRQVNAGGAASPGSQVVRDLDWRYPQVAQQKADLADYVDGAARDAAPTREALGLARMPDEYMRDAILPAARALMLGDLLLRAGENARALRRRAAYAWFQATHADL